MIHLIRQSLFIAATGLMVSVPMQLAVGEEPAMPSKTPDATAYAVQQMPCAGRAEVVKMLRDNFGETPVAHGLAHTGAVAEVFLGPKGTWTIVATSPNGLSCMVGSGESWQNGITRDGTI